MGATKKRRRTKHRGNAAGMIESRGRTGTRGSGAGDAAKGGPRVPTPPSWNKSATKALLPVAILLPFLIFTQKDVSIFTLIVLCLIAYAAYVPLAFYTDRWVYNRFVTKQQQ